MDILLRFLKEEDLQNNHARWMQDPEVTKYNSHGLFPKTSEEQEAFIKSLDSKNNCVFGIFDVSPQPSVKVSESWETGLKKLTCIGNVALQNINWVNRSAELAVVIGEKDYWSRGVATQACMQVLAYGFKNLNLNRIWTGTASTNGGMQKVCEKIGMTKEGVFKQGMFLSGEWVDIYTYAILQSETLESRRKQCADGACACKKDNKDSTGTQTATGDSFCTGSGVPVKRDKIEYILETCVSDTDSTSKEALTIKSVNEELCL